MMFKLFLTSPLPFTALLTAIVCSVDAICLPCQANFSNLRYPGLPRRAVYNPRITSPTVNTKWKSGSWVTVTWDHHGIPAGADCTILLGYLTPASDDEHLTVDQPLDKCEMDRGMCTFKLPKVPPRDDYIVVLMGDSGNRSPTFRIVEGQ